MPEQDMYINPLKPSLLLILLMALFQISTAQQRPLTMEEMINTNNLPGRNNKDLFISSKITTFNSRPSPFRLPLQGAPQRIPSARSSQGLCTDTSLFRILSAEHRSFSFWCSAKTADGGILLGGFGRDQTQGPPYLYMGTVVKLDRQGNPVWSKEIISDVYSTLSIESIKELSDGSIIISGTHNNAVYYATGNEYNDFFVGKLSNTGDLAWLKTFHQKLPSSCSSVNVYESSIGEGKNGDILVTGTIWNCPLPKYLLAFKLTSNGELQWKYSFLDAVVGDAYGVGIFYQNDEVVLINKSSNFGSTGDNVIHVDFVRLSYNTGIYISQKSWKVDKNPLDAFFYSYINSVNASRLSNGNYVVYGQTFGDMQQNNNNLPKLSVLEFDSNFDFLNGYTINSTLITNYAETRMNVNEYGMMAFGLTSILSNENKDKYIGAAKRGTIYHQRKKEFRGYEYFYDNVEVFEDDSYAYTHNLATPGQTRFDLHYGLLHNTDTGSNCLGLSVDFFTVERIKYIPYSTSFVSIHPDPIAETMNRANGSANLIFDASAPCIQIAECTSLIIKGDTIACDKGHLFSFVASRPADCGASVRWRIDTSSVSSLFVKNDSTIEIIFNKSWQGKLYADINNKCGTVSDSVEIIYTDKNPILNLGNDTSICKGNTLKLNAREGFVSYLWNNGSTDSTIIITTPGKYFVTVKNACGTALSDTIIVGSEQEIVFSIGNDTTICSNQKLTLKGPANFISYNWGPDFNLVSSTAQQVTVTPKTDTIYYLRAGKKPGCFGSDTIHITVKPTPELLLQPDTSLCFGDTMTLDAGDGFSSYHWSNGSTNQVILVYEPNSFSVKATTAEGCVAYDTTTILNLWPRPAADLNDINGICRGEQIVLDPGNFAAYIWQDGSTAQNFTVTTTGTYQVIVTDRHGCTGSDTVYINNYFEAPVDILHADTGFCRYETLTIKAGAQYSSYLWNTNSTTESITISVPGNFWLMVKDDNGCTGRDTISVSQKDCMEGFHVPNAFTPNNDRLNDVFKPLIGGNILQFRLSIYNRWGEMIYSSSNHLKGWDGSFKGSLQNSGQYTWTCTFLLEGQLPQKRKGTVYLIR